MIGIKIKQKKSAFSLIEVIVSVIIFTIIILSATKIFKLVIDGQRSAIASQNVQESLKYFLEVVTKEMRMAEKNDGTCPGVPMGQIFALSNNSLGDVLQFRNYYNQCISYSLAQDSNSQRFKISRGTESGFISPKKITIDRLNFSLRESSSTQAMVTISIKAHSLYTAQLDSNMTIQTSISSRYYR